MSDWVRVASLNQLPVNRGRFFELRGHELAVFRLSNPERVVVVSNCCPHAGGNIAAGDVDGACVTCPWHQWQFNLETGVSPLSESARLTIYESRVVDQHVEARLPPKRKNTPSVMV
ncbi:MAG: Rieske 2Fe-2S domain-containing protein [Phycisphaerae bacterium]|nr:Rieske 2Fe-2S domain-containing protein [Phycisphaerae bacterium]